MVLKYLATVLFLLLVAALSDPALAGNKFTTIGSGVSGGQEEKVFILKRVGAYTGIFLILLGGLSLLTRDRFEGFIGLRRKGRKASRAPYILMLIGALLALLFFA